MDKPYIIEVEQRGSYMVKVKDGKPICTVALWEQKPREDEEQRKHG